MASRVTGQEVLANTSTGSRTFTKGQYLNLKPDEKEGVTIKRVRLVGYPILFWQCTEHQYDKSPDSKKGDKVKVPFPDAKLNDSYTRIMKENTVIKDGKRVVSFEDDPWYEMGYLPQKRYAINCIDRETGEVCILTKGHSLFEQFAKAENINVDTNADTIAECKESGEEVDPDSLLWTVAGGELAPDFKIRATPDARWQVKYEVIPQPKVKPLTDEEIEKLRAIGAPTAEEIAKAREEDPSLKDMPDWFLYGYPLDKMFKPSEIKTESRREETSFSDEELDDPDLEFNPTKAKSEVKSETPVSLEIEDEDTPPTPVAKKKASKPKVEEVAGNDESDDGNMEW